MNSDDFEHLLEQQPLRPPPPGWREEILTDTRIRSALSARSGPGHRSLLAGICNMLWPHPAAWGGMAACWVAILTLNRMSEPTQAELAQAREASRIAIAYSTLLNSPSGLRLTAEPENGRPSANLRLRRPLLGCTEDVRSCVS